MQLSQNGFWLAEKQRKTRANWIRAKYLQQHIGRSLELLRGPGVENRPRFNIYSLFLGRQFEIKIGTSSAQILGNWLSS